MSLIRIRGRTILAPILSETERVEARALRDRAVKYQHKCQRRQQQLPKHHNHPCHSPQSMSTTLQGHENNASGKLPQGFKKNKDDSHSSLLINQGISGETSSPSCPSSQESGVVAVSCDQEDSPSAANVSVQTESSMSLTASTDLGSYLNTSLDTSTSISVDTRQWTSPSQASVDEMLLLSVPPELATDLILGRIAPSAVLNSSSSLRSSQPESQQTETASGTLIQGQRSSKHHTVSEGQDTTTTASLSLSCASVSEEPGEGSEEGLEATDEILEGSEELLDGSEEDHEISLPRELDSDPHRDEMEGSEAIYSKSAEQKRKDTQPSAVGDCSTPRRERNGKDAREGVWGLQRDSGRGSSHSDYLDDYLELLTSRSSSNLSGHQASAFTITSCKPTVPVTSYSQNFGVTTSVSETSNQCNSSADVLIPSGKETEKTIKNCETCPDEDIATLEPVKATELISKERKGSNEKSEKVSRDSKESQKSREGSPHVRASSAASVRETRRSRSRRWSYHQSDPNRSVGSKYLDSYLGKLTDDAWLQFPTRLGSRHMVFLDSDEYMQSVRPQSARKSDASQESQDSCTDQFEISSSDETKLYGSSTAESEQSESLMQPKESSLEEIPFHDTKICGNSTGMNMQSSIETSKQQPESLFESGESNVSSHDVTRHDHSMSVTPLVEPRKNEKPERSNDADQASDVKNGVKLSDGHPDTIYEATEANMQPSDAPSRLHKNDMLLVVRNEYEYPETFEVLGSKDQQNFPCMGNEQVNAQIGKEINVRDKEPFVGSYEKVPTDEEALKPGDLAPAFKIAEAISFDHREEGKESSSDDDSSETEPSTIVYVDDCPVDSPSESRSLLLTENKGGNFPQANTEVKTNMSVEYKVLSSVEKEDKQESTEEKDSQSQKPIERKSSSTDSTNVKESFTDGELVYVRKSPQLLQSDDKLSLDSETTGIGATQRLDGSPRRITQTPMEEGTVTREYPSNSIHTKRQMDFSQERITISEPHDHEEECLVVQVYGDNEIIASHTDYNDNLNQLKADKPGELESKCGVYHVESEKTTNKFINESKNGIELELDQGSEGDVMDQVLTLLRVKQEQEMEELKQRQEEEIRHLVLQLKKVSPQQLMAFLATSNSGSESAEESCQNFADDKNIAHSPKKIDVEVSTESATPKKEGFGLYKGNGGGSDNDDSNGDEVKDRSADPLVSDSLCSHISRDQMLRGSSPLSMSYQPGTTYTSSVTCTPTTLHLAEEKMMGPLDKPQPSNHINLMPSYFMNVEKVGSAGALATDNQFEYRVVTPESMNRISPGPCHHIIPAYKDSRSSSIDNSNLMRNNNTEMRSHDIVNFTNGNCGEFGDGMQYYRLYTADEESNGVKSSQPVTLTERKFQPITTEMVPQPGFFRVFDSSGWPSPRPTSITNLLKEHPEIFGQEVVEVTVAHGGEWGPPEVVRMEHCAKSTPPYAASGHLPPAAASHATRTHRATTAASSAEGGLDMVPERENAACIHHYLEKNVVFVRGIIRLQACVRRYLTQRLLRTKFIQEQLATLAEIAKLAQQFHRDILTDNIHKGDVDFHNALYKQEGLARERIRRVFGVLTVSEQMSLIHRDHELWQLQEEREHSKVFQSSPAHISTRQRNKATESRPETKVTKKVLASKRTSPSGRVPQPDVKSRAVPSMGRINSQLVEPSIIQQPTLTHVSRKSTVDQRTPLSSPRVSRLPVHVDRPPTQTRSSHDTRPSHQMSSRCSVHTRSSSSSSSSSTLSQHMHKSSSHVMSVTRRSSCTARSSSSSNSPRRGTPTKAATKTTLVGRRPWR